MCGRRPCLAPHLTARTPAGDTPLDKTFDDGTGLTHEALLQKLFAQRIWGRLGRCRPAGFLALMPEVQPQYRCGKFRNIVARLLAFRIGMNAHASSLSSMRLGVFVLVVMLKAVEDMRRAP